MGSSSKAIVMRPILKRPFESYSCGRRGLRLRGLNENDSHIYLGCMDEDKHNPHQPSRQPASGQPGHLDDPNSPTRESIWDSDGVSLIMVCGAGRCSVTAPETINALRELVRATEHAVLIRTACLAGTCRGRPRNRCAQIRLQTCTAALQPRGPAAHVSSRDLSCQVTTVRAWLRSNDPRP